MTSLFVFKKPLHSRTTDASGVQKIVYTFPVDATDSLCGAHDSAEHRSLLQTLHSLLTEEQEWILRFVETFLTATKAYFVKPYSSSVILRYLAHRVHSAEGDTLPAGPVAFTPTAVVIRQGQFTIEWLAQKESIDIEIPDEEIASAPASTVVSSVAAPAPAPTRPANTVVLPPTAPVAAPLRPTATAGEGLSALDADALPYTGEGEVLSLRTPEQQAQERRRVREAHLRAKLAQYKAERTMTKYIQKYGDDLSYSSSESGWDTEGEDGSESE
jgi:hypothetical protein